MPAVAGHEHPARVVDPDLLHGRVVEVGLQRPEARDPRDELTHDGVDVGDRIDRTGQRALVVVAYDALGDPPYQRCVALRVDPLAADLVAHALVERLDQLRVGFGHRHGSPVPSEVHHEPTSLYPPFREGAGKLWRTGGAYATPVVTSTTRHSRQRARRGPRWRRHDATRLLWLGH